MNKLSEQQFKDRIDLSMRQHIEANHYKELLERLGYRYTISLYGVLHNTLLNRHEYRKIEVFLNGTPKERDVMLLQHFFEDIKPLNYFSIWVYDHKTKTIKLVESWE